MHTYIVYVYPQQTTTLRWLWNAVAGEALMEDIDM